MAVRAESHAEPIPGYRLLERLGGGGFGEVWKCVAPGGLHKAIKFVFGDLSSAGGESQRADQELKALKRVQTVRHPYILTLERYDIIDGQLMIVMELADRNLWDRFKECRANGLPGIPRDELLGYMEECAEALDLMNGEYQLQHLDIKPQNIFLVHQHVKVADFGLVKDLEGSQASITGGITPVYAAPETFDGKVSRFSDQYSLGIVYQELLTGQRPFSGTNVRQLILQHLQATPNVTPLPESDQAPILRALSKHPTERYPTCRELVQALRGGDAAPAVSPSHAGGAAPPGALTVPRSVLAEGLAAPAAPPDSGPMTACLRQPAPETGANAHGSTHRLRPFEPVLGSTEAGFTAPPEITGPGALMPAVVIGLGQMGLMVMQRLREVLNTHVAPLTQLPHLRFLLLDTDPDIVRAATRGATGASLSANEVQLAQLNRPSYYLKGREGRPSLEPWFNPRMIYRIPRSQVTAGVRALGRLAFCDNYRGIARRLQHELEAALNPEALDAAAANTALGVRTNRPRVYVVTSLAGGTGSGMFLDVAYTLRALLRQMGYESPDIVGLLLLPPVEGNRARLMGLGNTYAALTELSYFGQPGAVFQAKYHEREPALQEEGPPFSRNVLLPLPDESDEVGVAESVELCGQALYRELVTPLGKAADLARAGLPSPPWGSRGQYFQTFGLFQLAWPRHSLLQEAGRGLCQRVVARWMSKDSKPLREEVGRWIQDEWARRELGGEQFIERLQMGVARRLSGSAESLFQKAIEPLGQPAALADAPGRGRSRLDGPALKPEAVAEVLAELDGLLGRPGDDVPQEEPPRLVRLLREVSDKLAEAWGQQLAELSVRLIESPEFRLAGAEESIRQLVAIIEQVLGRYEPLTKELAQKAQESSDHLRNHVAAVKAGRKASLSAAEVINLAKAYPKWRYQALILQHLSASFVGLRGHLSDELREVNFCRVRLGELLRQLETPPGHGSAQGVMAKKGGIGKRLFLDGCRNQREAVEKFLEGFTAAHLLELDRRMEEMLKSKFTALVHVCLTSANILRDVESAMLKVASDFAGEMLPPTSVAALFFDQHPEAEQAEGEVARYFDEAAPELAEVPSGRGGPPVVELALLAAPDEPASAAFRQLARRSASAAEVHQALSPDDIIFYRERLNLPLAELEQLGAVAYDAYAQMNATENFTPHSRCDIAFGGR